MLPGIVTWEGGLVITVRKLVEKLLEYPLEAEVAIMPQDETDDSLMVLVIMGEDSDLGEIEV